MNIATATGRQTVSVQRITERPEDWFARQTARARRCQFMAESRTPAREKSTP